jgi:hypothetical protein
VRELQGAAAAQAGRLLRVLFVRERAVPAGAGEAAGPILLPMNPAEELRH